MGSLFYRLKSTVKNLFKFNNPKEILTLFHKPSDPSSSKILQLLRSAQSVPQPSGARPAANTTASQKSPAVTLFELDIIETPNLPTPQQFSTIIQFLGRERINDVFRGVKDEEEAIKLLTDATEGRDSGRLEGTAMSERFVRPLVVDWGNGRVVVGADEERVTELVAKLRHDK